MGRGVRKSKEEWIAQCIKKNGDKFDYSDSDYSGTRNQVTIRCKACNYTFERRADMHADRINRCPNCEGGQEKITPEVYQKRLKLVHGDEYTFDPSDYISLRKKVKLTCNTCKLWKEDIDYFYIRADSVIYRGSGCPRCYMKKRGFKSEKKFGEILRTFFPDNTFIKIRPDFLSYPKSGKKLELDFYCKELGIAFEVNGIQHYEFIKYFHGDEEGFQHSLKKDLFKKNACLKNGIVLHSFDLRKLTGKDNVNKKIMKEYIANIKNNLYSK